MDNQALEQLSQEWRKKIAGLSETLEHPLIDEDRLINTPGYELEAGQALQARICVYARCLVELEASAKDEQALMRLAGEWQRRGLKLYARSERNMAALHLDARGSVYAMCFAELVKALVVEHAEAH